MIAHTGLLVKNYKKSKMFYLKALKPLGYTLKMEFGRAGGFNDGKNTDLWIGEGKVVPGHLAFEAKNKRQVEAWYKAALKAGGRDNGAPGYRSDYWPGYYAAFVYDPNGHNIEAVWYDYARARARAKSKKK